MTRHGYATSGRKLGESAVVADGHAPYGVDADAEVNAREAQRWVAHHAVAQGVVAAAVGGEVGVLAVDIPVAHTRTRPVGTPAVDELGGEPVEYAVAADEHLAARTDHSDDAGVRIEPHLLGAAHGVVVPAHELAGGRVDKGQPLVGHGGDVGPVEHVLMCPSPRRGVAYIVDVGEALVDLLEHAGLGFGILRAGAGIGELVGVHIKALRDVSLSVFGGIQLLDHVLGLCHVHSIVLVVGYEHHIAPPGAELRGEHVFLELVEHDVCLLEALHRHSGHSRLYGLPGDVEA